MSPLPTDDSSTDIAIVGGGWTGASLACALADSAYRVTLIEPRIPAGIESTRADANWDARVYAVSPGSEAFLSDMDVWQRMDAGRIQAVRRMRVFGGHDARLEFSAYQSCVARLAAIVEARALQQALWSRLASALNVNVRCPASATAFDWQAGYCNIHLANGERLRARLVVGADGMQSAVRAAKRIDARIEPAGQSAVVANFTCEREHAGVAYQWFGADGVLAWLPLPGRNISMVWSAVNARARELMELPGGALCEEVARIGNHTLGDLTLHAPPKTFPLAWMSVRRRVASRVVLVGDAAHVIHPLAGQGVNLGLGDARELARILRAAGERGEDPGCVNLLRQFERARAEAILTMQLATQGLHRLFASESKILGRLRDTGLNLVDRAPVLKQIFARRALE